MIDHLITFAWFLLCVAHVWALVPYVVRFLIFTHSPLIHHYREIRGVDDVERFEGIRSGHDLSTFQVVAEIYLLLAAFSIAVGLVVACSIDLVLAFVLGL